MPSIVEPGGTFLFRLSFSAPLTAPHLILRRDRWLVLLLLLLLLGSWGGGPGRQSAGIHNGITTFESAELTRVERAEELRDG